MFDDRGDEVVSLVADRDDPILSLTSTRGGLPRLNLRGPGGREGVALYSDADGSLGLMVAGEGRSGQWNVRPDEQGRPILDDHVGGPDDARCPGGAAARGGR